MKLWHIFQFIPKCVMVRSSAWNSPLKPSLSTIFRGACHKLSSDTIKFHRGKAGKASRTSYQGHNAAEWAKNHNKSFWAMSQLLINKMNCQKCEILLEICKQRNSVGDELARKSCCIWVWQFCCHFNKKHMMFVRAHNHDSVSLVFILVFEA